MMVRNATGAWLDLVEQVTKYGVVQRVRSLQTREILGGRAIIDMEFPFVDVPLRRISEGFRFAEAAWVLSGDSRVNHLLPHAPSMSKFSDDGYFLQGAYGPKVVQQLNYVIETLEADSTSRQAVIGIWRENPRYSKDIPCTLTLQFMIRGRQLDCFFNMRSSDMWLGAPYDWFTMSMVAAAVLIELRRRTKNDYMLGNLHYYAASCHLYESTEFRAVKCIADNAGCDELPQQAFDYTQFSYMGDLVDWLKERAAEEKKHKRADK